MTADGAIPRPEDRGRHFTQTGAMDDSGNTRIWFGTENGNVVIIAGPDIVLGRAGQDLFARHLFRAMHAAGPVTAADVPY